MQKKLITGIPNPSPLSQTAKLRLSAATKASLPLFPAFSLVFKNHFPGVLPHVLSKMASNGIHTKYSNGTKFSYLPKGRWP